MDDGRDTTRHVVTVEADVELAHGGGALDSLDLIGELLGDVCAATHDADEGDVASPLVVLDDLVGDAGEGSRHRRSVHDGRLGCDLFHVAPFTKKDACA